MFPPVVGGTSSPRNDWGLMMKFWGCFGSVQIGSRRSTAWEIWEYRSAIIIIP